MDQPETRTADEIAADNLAKRIARIQANPLLVALSKITDLGCCGGRGNFQKALDIAVDALEAEAKLPAPDQFYIAWNGSRTEGFVTEDENDAYTAQRNVDAPVKSTLAEAFFEAYGDDPVTIEEITIVVDKAHGPEDE